MLSSITVENHVINRVLVPEKVDSGIGKLVCIENSTLLFLKILLLLSF